MKLIPLTRGLVAVVDDADYDRVNAFSWSARPARQKTEKWYAARTSLKHERGDGPAHNILLHRFILEAPKGLLVDHINGNSLDNRRENLRLCEHSQSVVNRAVPLGKNQFRGVEKMGTKYRARARWHGDWHNFGRYATAQEAAMAYDAGVRQLHGEFARLNFPVAA